MRKLKLQMQVSVDGYVAGPEGQLDWMTWDMGDELHQFTAQNDPEPKNNPLPRNDLSLKFNPWKKYYTMLSHQVNPEGGI